VRGQCTVDTMSGSAIDKSYAILTNPAILAWTNSCCNRGSAMGARLRSWWQKIKKHPYATGIVVFLVLMLFIFSAYKFGWDWTGFNSGTSQITITSTSKVNYTATVPQPTKSLWDWMQLLIIPLVLAIIAIWFNRTERRNELRITSDNQQEAALQEYIKEISELLLKNNLRGSDKDNEVRTIARVRTLTLFSRLEATRKRIVIRFLNEADLISAGRCIIQLKGADLRETNMRWLNLKNVDLSSVNLSNADLSEAHLNEAVLIRTFLHDTNLLLFRLMEAKREAPLRRQA
jgi:hypothetical protein